MKICSKAVKGIPEVNGTISVGGGAIGFCSIGAAGEVGTEEAKTSDASGYSASKPEADDSGGSGISLTPGTEESGTHSLKPSYHAQKSAASYLWLARSWFICAIENGPSLCPPGLERWIIVPCAGCAEGGGIAGIQLQ